MPYYKAQVVFDNTIRHTAKGGTKKDHKYVGRVQTSKGWRYFYTEAEMAAYNALKSLSESAKKTGEAASDTLSKSIESAKKTVSNSVESAKKAINGSTNDYKNKTTFREARPSTSSDKQYLARSRKATTDEKSQGVGSSYRDFGVPFKTNYTLNNGINMYSNDLSRSSATSTRNVEKAAEYRKQHTSSVNSEKSNIASNVINKAVSASTKKKTVNTATKKKNTVIRSVDGVNTTASNSNQSSSAPSTNYNFTDTSKFVSRNVPTKKRRNHKRERESSYDI